MPSAELEQNTTWDLVNDIENIRKYLSIENWVVFGGSWGSTLSLSYAIKYPNKCNGLILRGIFLLRESEIKWFYQEGCSYLYPDEWENYTSLIPDNEKSDYVSAYYKRLTSPDDKTRYDAAKRWAKWEASTSKLIPNKDSLHHFDDIKIAEAFSRIECHYFINKGFFEYDGWILDHVDTLSSIPISIVQGRYDVVCPMQSAWDLHKKISHSKLYIIPDSGHSMLELGIQKKLIELTESFSKI